MSAPSTSAPTHWPYTQSSCPGHRWVPSRWSTLLICAICSAVKEPGQ